MSVFKNGEEKAVVEFEYNGHKIGYIKNAEEWFTYIKGHRNAHGSLKVVQAAIDRSLRTPFERIPVIVEKRDREYGRAPNRFVNGEITSVGIDGTLYIVLEGQKAAEAHRSVYIKSKANDIRIRAIVKADEDLKDARDREQKARWKLQQFDGQALRNKVLGKQ